MKTFGFHDRCPCCGQKWSACPCTSVMCPRDGKECIEHCGCSKCHKLLTGGVARSQAEGL